MWRSASGSTYQWEGGVLGLTQSQVDGRENLLLARDVAAARMLGQCTHTWVTHRGKRERSGGHNYGPPGKVRRSKWLWKTKTDLQKLASSQVHPELTLYYHRRNHWGGLPGTRQPLVSCNNPRRRLFLCRSALGMLPRRGVNKFGPELPHPSRGSGRSCHVRKLCWALMKLPMSKCEMNKNQLMETNYYLKEFSTDVFKTVMKDQI